jgi:hypothetical protein
MYMMTHHRLVDPPVIRKLEISGSLRLNFLKRLQSMDVHPGTLFPDLSGLAQSLTLGLEIQMDDLRQEHDEQMRRQEAHYLSSAKEDRDEYSDDREAEDGPDVTLD